MNLWNVVLFNWVRAFFVVLEWLKDYVELCSCQLYMYWETYLDLHIPVVDYIFTGSIYISTK